MMAHTTCDCTARHSALTGSTNSTSAQLLDNFTTLTFTAKGLAAKYRKYGTRYHKLPLSIRNQQKIPLAWKLYCQAAFIVSAEREMPDPIQGFDMLEATFKKGWYAVFDRKVEVAKKQLYVAARLIIEVEDRVEKLQFAVKAYEALALSMQDRGDGEPGSTSTQADEDQMGEAKVVWMNALPKLCGKTN